MQQQQAYGTWPSPITAELVTSASIKVGDVACIDNGVFWSEVLPEEKSRCVLVKRAAGQEPVTLTPMPFNVRTRVHEYGGRAWWIDANWVYFVNWQDQRLYRVSHVDDAAKPYPITPEPEQTQSLRYADGCISADGRQVFCVRERDVHGTDGHQVINELVVINVQAHTGESYDIRVIASGADFYSNPRLSADSKYLSWIQWQHPQMPWDGTELMVATIVQDGCLSDERRIAGDTTTAIVSALWAHGRLVYASDESGWWNLNAYDVESNTYAQLTHLSDADISIPPWVFGLQRFVEFDKGLGVIVTRAAQDELHVLDAQHQLQQIDIDLNSIDSLCSDEQGGLIVCGQNALSNKGIYQLKITGGAAMASCVALRAAEPLPFEPSWISKPEAISFASLDRTAHAFFYAPSGADLHALDGELPPLVVMGHGGPTSHATPALKLSVQYWTSRGVAVVDVNYGGSSGFGRDYRRLLNGQWGVIDVEDCIAAAQHLAALGKVDAKRIVIRGGSAGGLTVLRALQLSDTFAAGTSLYGVSDLESLAGDTHKFESRYLDGLIGGTYPEHQALYKARSPIHFTADLNSPLLVMQGDEDKVVPPSQSEAIVNAVAKKSLPHAYILFAGEQHGFRQSHNIVRALQTELWFYGQVLGFTPHDDIEAPSEAVGF